MNNSINIQEVKITTVPPAITIVGTTSLEIEYYSESNGIGGVITCHYRYIEVRVLRNHHCATIARQIVR